VRVPTYHFASANHSNSPLSGTNSGMTIAFGGLFLFGASVSGVLLGDSPATNFPKAIALNGTMLAVTSVLFL
jgi:hypothetical protein